MTKRYTFCAVLTALVLHTAVFAQKTVPSVALQKGTSLWNKKTEGMMEWAKIDLEAGTELVSYLSSEEGELPVALTEESSWTTAKNNQTMAFGDGENDITMLKCVGIGVAMGNGKEELKKEADYVTADIDDDGIEKALIHFGVIDA